MLTSTGKFEATIALLSLTGKFLEYLLESRLTCLEVSDAALLPLLVQKNG